MTMRVPRPHNSIILLLDQSRGRIGAAVEAVKPNAYRTAAAEAVAGDALARPDAAVFTVFGAGHQTVFGAGHQAEHEVRALARIRKPSRVMVVARNPEKGNAFVADLKVELDQLDLPWQGILQCYKS